MARLVVLTDRSPDDVAWKGACAWELIRQLAESQHEVLVLTTLDPETVEVTHPRLTVARPAPSWRAEKLPKFAQALIQFRPEVVHWLGVKPSPLWSGLTVWPYLNALTRALPNVKQMATFFDSSDFNAAPTWTRVADGWTLFSPDLMTEARKHFSGPIEVLPVDASPRAVREPSENVLLIPAPVSEWHQRILTLNRLRDLLNERPECHAEINGGWGDLSIVERREGWERLRPVADRIRLLEAQSLARFRARLKQANGLWLEAMAPGSFRDVLSRRLLSEGSDLLSAATANRLSRLYLE